MFTQFNRTLTSDSPDNHPDAHACRLKLNLAVLYSDNKTPWEMHIELDRYLGKLAHVSAECRSDGGAWAQGFTTLEKRLERD